MAAPALRAESAQHSLPEGSFTSVELAVSEKAVAGDCIAFAVMRYETQTAPSLPAGMSLAGTINGENKTGGEKKRLDLFVVPNWDGTTKKFKVTWATASSFLLIDSWAVSGADHATPVSGVQGVAIKEPAGTVTVPKYAGGSTTGRTFVVVDNSAGFTYPTAPAGYTKLLEEVDHGLFEKTAESAGEVAAVTVEIQFGSGGNLQPQLALSATFQPPVAEALPPIIAAGVATATGALHARNHLPTIAAAGVATTAGTLSARGKAVLPTISASGVSTAAAQLRSQPRLQVVAMGEALAVAMLTVPGPPGYSRIAVTREYPPDKLTVLIRDPASKALVGRWAQDEPDVANVFSGLSKSSEMNGGHKDFGCTLSRDPRTSWPDLPTYADIEVQGAGREKVWEGYLRKQPRTDGDHMVIGPEASGHAAMLDDNTAPNPFGYIDSDQSKFGEPSTQRQIDSGTAFTKSSGEVAQGWQGTGASPPAILMTIGYEEGHPLAEAWYSGGGPTIGRLLWSLITPAPSPPGTGIHCFARISEDDHLGGGFWSSADMQTTPLELAEIPEAFGKYVVLQLYYEGEYAGAGKNTVGFTNLTVLGSQDLQLQGVWPNVGFAAKQMLADAIPRMTPLSVDPENEDDGFVITQAWYPALGGMSEFVKDVTKYGELYWFVYGDKLLQYRRRGTFGRRWKAYAGPSGLRATGEDGTRLWAELVVEWTDVDGTQRTIGPAGSGCTFEDGRLEIRDPEHPALRAKALHGPNFLRRDKLVLNGESTATLALTTGIRALGELNELDHSGEATLSGYVQTDAGVWLPASYVQAGDEVQFPDASDRSWRFITSAPYSDDSKSVPVTLDAPPEGMLAVQERNNARLERLRPSG